MITFDKTAKAPDNDETKNQFAQHVATGKAWDARFDNDSNMGKLSKGLAAPMNSIQVFLETLAREFNINTSDQLLPEWDASVKLPDGCQIEFESIEDEISAIIRRISRVPVVDVADVEQLILDLTGVTANVYPGTNKFVLYIELLDVTQTGFIYNFPYPFGSTRIQFLICVLDNVMPANIVIDIL